MELLKIVEKNHLGHFKFLPQKLGFEVYEMKKGVTMINCMLKTSMFNIVYGLPKSLDNFSDFINEIKEIFTNQPFAWWVPSSRKDAKATENLIKAGFVVEAPEYVMICDLNKYSKATNNKITNSKIVDNEIRSLKIKQVKDKSSLEDFLKILSVYDSHSCEFYYKMSDELFDSNEKLFVGYINDEFEIISNEQLIPVTIGILFCQSDNAGVFTLITDRDHRRKGYGTKMMKFLINVAKENGCKSVSLSASNDAGRRIYEKLGFKTIGKFESFEHIYGTAPQND